MAKKKTAKKGIQKKLRLKTTGKVDMGGFLTSFGKTLSLHREDKVDGVKGKDPPWYMCSQNKLLLQSPRHFRVCIEVIIID